MQTMSNSIDYTTISNQPHQITLSSSKPQPPKETISTNQSGGLILRPSETLDHQRNDEQLKPEESDKDHPLQLPSSATKTNNAAGDARTTTSWSPYVYWECKKNHVASLGRYAVDGCREFMPSGEEGTAQALECAACGCHRSFHRRDVKANEISKHLICLANNQHTYYQYPVVSEINTGERRPRICRPSTIPPRHQDSHKRPEMMACGGFRDSSSQDLNMIGVNVRGREKTMTDEAPSCKKRFRTKFSKEHKVRMQQAAEEMGWKIQKKEHEEEQVKQLCDELGVKRQVFKVWMHNNKHK